MSTEPVLLQIESGIARITLNRPERLNAFNSQMHGALRTAIARVAEPSHGVRVLVLTGAGRGFCAGQDLGERRQIPGAPRADLGESIETRYKPLILSLRALPLPVLAAVNGVAAGAGASLALASDIVLAAHSASFILAFARIGLVPDAGATWILPRLIGSARALGMSMLGEPVSAEQAERWGLIWRTVADEALASETDALAQRLAAGAPLALAHTKAAVYGTWERDFGAQLDVERDSQRTLGYSDDYAEGVAAFAAKRTARFTGR